MARIAALLALAATLGSLASCGGTSSTARSTATTRRATAPASEAPTRSTALAFAHAVNLSATDVPGFTASATHEHETKVEKRLQRKLLGCLGGGRSEPTLASVSSPSFKREAGIVQQGLSSSVSVTRTSAGSRRELAELRSNHTRACLQSYLDQLFKGPAFHGAPVDHVSISRGVPPSFGTTGSFAWRITVGFTVHSIRIPFYLDVLGFVYGPSQVMLLSSGLPVPFPAKAEEHLFSVLAARARAQGV
jgi:hypothetical protein